MDKLKLVGAAVALVAVGSVAMWFKQCRPGDDEIVATVEKLTEEMCACTDIGCANWVAEQFDKKVGGKKVAAGGERSAYGKAGMMIEYMKQCHQYISSGEPFTVERDHDNKIKFIRPASLPDPSKINLDLKLD